MNDIDRLTIFSGVLRVLMKDRKVTSKELAEKLGITQPAVNNYMAGKAFPVVKNLCKLADFFGVTPDKLLGYSKLKDEEFTKPEAPAPKKLKNIELAASFRRQLTENGKTLADYKEISTNLHDAIYKNTKI